MENPSKAKIPAAAASCIHPAGLPYTAPKGGFELGAPERIKFNVFLCVNISHPLWHSIRHFGCSLNEAINFSGMPGTMQECLAWCSHFADLQLTQSINQTNISASFPTQAGFLATKSEGAFQVCPIIPTSPGVWKHTLIFFLLFPCYV